MKKIHLTPRLQMAADMVVQNERNGWLVDVGTDHAYLPAWLLQNRRTQFAYVIAFVIAMYPVKTWEGDTDAFPRLDLKIISMADTITRIKKPL